MGRLDGKVIIITGGARGQGEAECRLFTAEGAKVVITDVLDAEGEAVAKETGALYFHHDVSQRADWERVVKEVENAHGRIDGLVNNAAIFSTAPIMETTDELWDRIIAINQTGAFLGMRTVAPVMARGGGGSIVNISSTAGLRGAATFFAYGASKWALRGMSKFAAVQLAGDNIRVNSVHPGGVDTAMSSMARANNPQPVDPNRRPPAQPIEIGYLVLFLLSDESRNSTGAEFISDTGLTAS